jgi:hypothetical protein
MNKEKVVWKIIFLILSLVFLYFLTDRFIFLAFKEKTEAQILSLHKSENESDLIVELKYNVSNQIIHTNKKIKFSFHEDFKGRENVGIFYNKKSPKNIYFENYGSTIYGDIFILLIPTLLFFIGFVSIKK